MAEDAMDRAPRSGTQVFRQELSPVSFLERAGDVHRGVPAIVDDHVHFTWDALRARARQMASALRKRGVAGGDRIAFLALNSEPLFLAHYGVPLAGAVLVPMNTRMNADEVAYIVDHAGAKMV